MSKVGTKSVFFSYDGNTIEMRNCGAFGERVNKRLKAYWIEFGEYPDVEQVMFEVLIDDYNQRKMTGEHES